MGTMAGGSVSSRPATWDAGMAGAVLAGAGVAGVTVELPGACAKGGFSRLSFTVFGVAGTRSLMCCSEVANQPQAPKPSAKSTTRLIKALPMGSFFCSEKASATSLRLSSSGRSPAAAWIRTPMRSDCWAVANRTSHAGSGSEGSTVSRPVLRTRASRSAEFGKRLAKKSASSSRSSGCSCILACIAHCRPSGCRSHIGGLV